MMIVSVTALVVMFAITTVLQCAVGAVEIVLRVLTRDEGKRQ